MSAQASFQVYTWNKALFKPVKTRASNDIRAKMKRAQGRLFPNFSNSALAAEANEAPPRSLLLFLSPFLAIPHAGPLRQGDEVGAKFPAH